MKCADDASRVALSPQYPRVSARLPSDSARRPVSNDNELSVGYFVIRYIVM